ncbi:MAG: UDP-N-acetylglucosamine 2-epimerase (non-hydrolyzing) [Bacteroidales bacterium]|jgi:UDP-GlcNAc3NAcA epimerase|nr:UDP-N-acetylglucosamine 2-epimerase (non-hydrolyzing) [Bacteroidales bacterium]
MKIVTIIGARPQFVKASMVSKAIANVSGMEEIIVHTGQHFDDNMSSLFFEELKIQKPTYHLNIGGQAHEIMIEKMVCAIVPVLRHEKPDIVLLYGDTDSTLAGALSAKVLDIKIAHVEAGLRSYNPSMQEEINREITDKLSTFLFCPTIQAIDNLKKENITRENREVFLVGDVMLDAALFYSPYYKYPASLPEKFVLCTLHRAENTDSKQRLSSILLALQHIADTIPVVLPLHPRTRARVAEYGLTLAHENIQCSSPLGYLEMQGLLNRAALVMTDSGGLQKEAYFAKKYCLTLREETEWTELVQSGTNMLSGADTRQIIEHFEILNARVSEPFCSQPFYGDGHAAEKIVRLLGFVHN